MSLTLALLLAVSLSNSREETPTAQQPSIVEITATSDERDSEREAAARDWLAKVDDFDWEASFNTAGKAFREPQYVANWQKASEMARVPLGGMIMRDAIAFEYVNAPPNGFEVVRFRTQFANRGDVIETVTLEREEDGLKVVGYFIK